MRELELPEWAEVGPEADRVSIVVKIDMGAAMDAWHDELGVEKPDQYSIETAYQCAKMDVQAALMGTEFDPQTCGMSAEIHFSNAPEWALKKHPVGRGAAAATRGHEARDTYARLRGAVPFT